MDNTLLIIIILTLVGLGCGVAIFLVNRFLPEEDAMLKKTEEISSYLPGMNCGACGHPGCFAYAGAVARDIDTLQTSPCMALMSDEDNLCKLGEALGVELSCGEKKVAVVHCVGGSEPLYSYEGVDTCVGAMQLSLGYNKCPYSCLGFGDCAKVCPVSAIHINSEKNVAEIDPKVCIGCGLCVETCPQKLIEIIPDRMPQYLACNYQSKKNIPGRERCDDGCIHCRLCLKAAEDGEVGWNEKKDLPTFDAQECKLAEASIEKCPKNIIRKRQTGN